MKKMILLLAVTLPIVASAQKFGYINHLELFQLMPELKSADAQLDSLNRQYENMLVSMQEEYQKKYADYQAKAATMTEAIRQIQEEELASMQQRMQTTYQTAQQDIEKQQQLLYAPIQERMIKAIQVVGEKQGFTYIFQSNALLYTAPEAMNVIEDVKKELGIK